jgi:hypothetical protein
MWATADLYGRTGEREQTPSTSDQVSSEGPVQRGSSISWLAVLGLFFVFRIAYEMAK